MAKKSAADETTDFFVSDYTKLHRNPDCLRKTLSCPPGYSRPSHADCSRGTPHPGFCSVPGQTGMPRSSALLGREYNVFNVYGCHKSVCLINASAIASDIFIPVSSSIHSHCPFGLHSRNTYSPSGVTMKSKHPKFRCIRFR